ncbi:MAG: restriction endonuclease subunit S [Acidobacteriota bacterium]|nr:restriction endonuclease subunit S [Acidobacteriota bacterium]MDQ3420879.1 restriction endonuclease subunit S [Acidobacteriota bacterium]
MSPTQLLAYFDRIAEAPGAVPRLRRFILDLAVRGKLVEQDAGDEPAAVLLKPFARKPYPRAKHGQENSKTYREQDHTLPAVPAGWSMTTLGDIASKITDGTHKTPTYIPAGVPFISVKNFSGGQLDFSSTRFISTEEHASLYRRCDPKRGDVLLGRIGTLGKAVVVDVDRPFSLFVSVAMIRSEHNLIAAEFLRLVLNSPYVEKQFDHIKVGGATHTNKLNLGDLHQLCLPLPPRLEQNRIVAKVDELMALCDRLEAAQAERERRREAVGSVALRRLIAPSQLSLPRRDVTFYVDQISVLGASGEPLSELRLAISALAVKGALVLQDPGDEPASELLIRIARQKRRARSSESSTKHRASDAVASVPGRPGWAAARLEDIVLELQTGPFGSSLHQSDYCQGGTPVINPASIRDGRIVPIETMAVDGTILDRLCTFRLRAGDVVLARRGEMGRAAAVTE